MMTLFEKVKKNNKLALVSLLLLGLMTYGGTLFTGFLSDDFGFIYQMENYGWEAFSHNFDDQFFIPLSHLIATGLYQIIGPNAFAFHLIQLLIHLLIGWQLYLLLKEYLSHQQKERIALLAAILFILLPYQTEAVVWLSSKSYGYSLFFGILFLRHYYQYKKTQQSKYLLLSFLWLIFSIHCKELGYVLPFILLCMEWIKGDIKTSLRILMGFLGVLIASLALRWAILSNPIGGYGIDTHVPNEIIPLTKNLIGYHLKFLAYPRYNWLMLVLTGVTILTPLLLTQKNKLKPILGLWIMFIILIAPVITLEISSLHSIASDRYGYWASIIVVVAISISIFNLPLKKASWFLGGIWIIICVGLTTKTNFSWLKASEIRDQYGQQLLSIESEKAYILNAPDNYQGAYVFRNGIEEYLRLNGKNNQIMVLMYQNYDSHMGGVQLQKNSEIIQANNDSDIYYYKNHYGIVFPVESKQFNIEWDQIPMDWDIYYYSNGKLHLFDHP